MGILRQINQPTRLSIKMSKGPALLPSRKLLKEASMDLLIDEMYLSCFELGCSLLLFSSHGHPGAFFGFFSGFPRSFSSSFDFPVSEARTPMKSCAEIAQLTG